MRKSCAFVPLQLALLLVLAVPAGATGADSAAQPWPQEQGDVPADNRVVWGRLESGFRYAIRRNTHPEGRTSLVLLVRAGSVDEQDDELGYAHLVEHLLFRGTRRFPGAKLVEQLQRVGVKFGADLNAFTSYTTTHYDLDLPEVSVARIGSGLEIMRDFADGGLFEADPLKQELKIVESERRDRETTQSVIADRLQAFLLPDSLLPRRPPIGSPKTLKLATSERLRRFYQKWYRADRMTLIAVGDFDVQTVESLVKDKFGSLASAGPPPPEPDLHNSAANRQTTAQYFPSSNDGGTSVLLCNVNPHGDGPDTIAARRSEISRFAAAGILQARLTDIARTAPLEYGTVQVTQQDYLSIASYGQIQIDSAPQFWRRTLRVAEQELRRAQLFGFTPAEVQSQAARLTAMFQESISTEPTWPSDWIAQQLRSQLEQNHVAVSPRDAWEIVASAVTQLTPETVAAQFNQDWSNGTRRIAVVGTRGLTLQPAEINAAYNESAQGRVWSHDPPKAVEFEYGTFGRPGQIKQQEYLPAIDVHSVQFANGVRLNFKPTDYEAGRIYLRLRLGRGMAQEPSYLPGLGLLTGTAFSLGGVTRHSPSELERVLAGRVMNLQFSVAEDAFYFDGYADRASLEILFQLCTAYLTDPAFRLSGFETATGLLQAQYQQAAHDPVRFAQSFAPGLMAGWDSRYGLAPAAKAFSRMPAQVQQWLQPVLQQGLVEIGVAGDIDTASVLAAATRTFGTLPARQPLPVPEPQRRPAYPAQALTETWKIESPEAKAMVRVHWPGTDDNDTHVLRRLQLLCEILEDRLRLKLRVEMGATYAPQVNAWGSRVYPGYGYLFADVITAPKQAAKVARMIRSIAADIATQGITPDEFERGRQPIVASLKQDLRNNSYWLWYVLTYMQEKPAVVELPLTREKDYLTMTVQELNALARSHLAPEHACSVIVTAKQ